VFCLIGKDLMHNLNPIVVGIDLAPGSTAAIKEAIRLARWNRASVHAVHVIDTLVAIELEKVLSPFQKDICDHL
jgi:nucleotide-binding universal stress UspA family protein